MQETVTISKKLYDRLVARDQLLDTLGQQHHVLRTRVDAYDEFGKVLFSKQQNETVLGGALFVLEKLANIKASMKVASINSILGINDVIPISESSATADDQLCLWGVGIGGAGDALGSRRTVQFYEREIGQNGFTDQMVPFRVVATPFTSSDENFNKYYLRRQRSDGLYEYYAKAFETDPFVKVLWEDGEEGADGSEVESDVYATSRTDGIETFMELHLQLTKKDIREYFQHMGEIEMARINTIGLFTGRKMEIEPGFFDYVNVKMFSKLTFENESLQNSKAISFRYLLLVS
jgi:hypothetical protein